MVWSATTDRGDLSQIADPDISSKTAKKENQMEKLNCSAGDLAIAIKAHNPSNIGSIVRVLRKHPNQYIIQDQIGQFIWMVEGSHLLSDLHKRKQDISDEKRRCTRTLFKTHQGATIKQPIGNWSASIGRRKTKTEAIEKNCIGVCRREIGSICH